ncbi:MAG: hypothetical protein IIB69_11220 [Proteobacteria bacterium]|nr:hypothetical protein [Pseudomonadota bacterium]
MTLTEAQTHLDAWLDADTATSKGQGYTIGNRALTRADARAITDKITYWNRVVKTLTAKNAGMKNPGVRIATWN